MDHLFLTSSYKYLLIINTYTNSQYKTQICKDIFSKIKKQAKLNLKQQRDIFCADLVR